MGLLRANLVSVIYWKLWIVLWDSLKRVFQLTFYFLILKRLSIDCLMGALFISRICDQFLVFVIYNFPRYCDK